MLGMAYRSTNNIGARTMNGLIRKIEILALACAVALPMSGCSWQTGRAAVTERQAETARARAADVARDMVGVSYRYGGRTPSGFDCSGLVFFAYQTAGLTVPRTSKDQYRAARSIAFRDAEPGDLLFFKGWRSVSHVGIYLGENRFVHAPSRGKQVTITRLDEEYYRKRLVSVGRL